MGKEERSGARCGEEIITQKVARAGFHRRAYVINSCSSNKSHPEGALRIATIRNTVSLHVTTIVGCLHKVAGEEMQQ